MIVQIVKRVLQNLAAYRKRSIMTIFGITWGMACFILLMAFGEGLHRVLLLASSYFGDRVVLVWNGTTSLQAGGMRAGRMIRTKPQDIEMIRQRCTLVKRSSPEIYQSMSLRWNDRVTSAGIRAVNDEYGDIRGMFMDEGRFLNAADLAGMRRVAVLGHEIRKRIFSQAPAIDEEIYINGVRFTVVGVLKKKIAFSSYFAQDDSCAFIPINVMGTLRDIRYNSVLVFQPVSASLEAGAIGQVRQVLAEIHKFNSADERALDFSQSSKIHSVINGIALAVKGLLNVIALLTLAVAGVGVMNIMLFNVQERTHEIGVLKAVGARRKHIRWQFLGEALVISLIGGLFGYLLAIFMAYWMGSIPFLGEIFEDRTGQADISLLVNARIAVSSFFTLVIIGLLSGTWPAIKASRLNPVDSLRNE